MLSLSLRALMRESTFLSTKNQMKIIEVTRLPSATYTRKNVKVQDVDMLFGKLNFQ
jgi:hypothetical protein